MHVQASDATFEDCMHKLRQRQEDLDDGVNELQLKEKRWAEWYSLNPALESRRPTAGACGRV